MSWTLRDSSFPSLSFGRGAWTGNSSPSRELHSRLYIPWVFHTSHTWTLRQGPVTGSFHASYLLLLTAHCSFFFLKVLLGPIALPSLPPNFPLPPSHLFSTTCFLFSFLRVTTNNLCYSTLQCCLRHSVHHSEKYSDCLLIGPSAMFMFMVSVLSDTFISVS